MARNSAAQNLALFDSGYGSGQGLTSPQAGGVNKEAFRNLPNISTADGQIYLIGSNPDNHFKMTLLEEGDVGGIVYDYGAGPVETGFQVIPMITGNGTQTNPANDTGAYTPSNTFDGVSEIHGGADGTAVENMIQTDYTGQYLLNGQVLFNPDSGQSNRQVEVEVWLFSSTGVPKFPIRLLATGNLSPGDKSNTIPILPAPIENATAYVAGDCLAMAVRKHSGEPNTTVTVQKCNLGLTLIGLGQN